MSPSPVQNDEGLFEKNGATAQKKKKEVKTMNKTYSALILAAIFAFCMIAPVYADKTYTVPGNYKITLPDGYKQSDSGDGEMDFDNDSELCYIAVISEKNEAPEIDVETLGKMFQKELEGDRGDITIKYGNVEKIGGRDVYVMYGKGGDKELTLSFFIYVFAFPDYMEVLMCACPEKIEDKKAESFNKIAESLRK